MISLQKKMGVNRPNAASCNNKGTSRLRAACDLCHKSKVKCNGGNPCNGCLKAQSLCNYSFANRFGRPLGVKNKKTRQRAKEAVKTVEHNKSTGDIPSPCSNSSRGNDSLFDEMNSGTHMAFEDTIMSPTMVCNSAYFLVVLMILLPIIP